MSFTVTRCTDRAQWDDQVNDAGGHPLQLWSWGQTKAAHAWTVDRVLVRRSGEREVVGSAQILLRKLPFPFRSFAYIPRGPQCSLPESVVELGAALADYVKRTHGSVVLSVEPDWEVPDTEPADSWEQDIRLAGWLPGSTVLIPRTLILDLQQSGEDLQAAMTKKHRQYIRKSAREDLTYRRVNRGEIGDCLAVYKLTAERAGFGIHEDRYYLDIFDTMGDEAPVFAAFKGDDVVAFLWLCTSRQTSFELYGGMTEDGERLRANYALKWFAIEQMKERGVLRYDFNGLLNDGVSRFKIRWASHENQLVGTWDKPLSRWYPVFAKALPLGRRVVRKGVPHVREAVGRAVPFARRALRR